MNRESWNDRRDRIRREQRAFDRHGFMRPSWPRRGACGPTQFDRQFKWMFIVGGIVAVIFAALWIVILAGGAAWLWGWLG